jgi:hypothetical protein
MKKQNNEWDLDDKIHPRNYKAIQRDKTLKYRVPIYTYEALCNKDDYEYDERQLHEVSWL